MLVRDAKAIARQWVEREASSLPGFYGAYLAGSMSSMPADAVLPDASDVDITVLLDDSVADMQPQKFMYRDVILDVSHAPRDEAASPEVVLGSYYTAIHFAYPSILSDPSGNLTEIQAIVARDYSRRAWVRKRCEHALGMLDIMLNASPFPHYDAVQMFLLGIIFTPAMVLVADLRNPTHRRGLANFGEVLTRYGHPELHERVLGVLGSAAMTRGEVEPLLENCADIFDAAKLVRKTPFLMASNISDFARPIVIGGGQELLDQGFHREAVAWIAIMHTMCYRVIQNDAPEDVKTRVAPGYERLLQSLELSTQEQIAAKKEEIGQLIPELSRVTESIINVNPAIRE